MSTFRSVALVVPNAVEMISLASVNSSITNFEDICRQPSVVALAFNELKDFAMKHLEKFEIPKQVRIYLVIPRSRSHSITVRASAAKSYVLMELGSNPSSHFLYLFK